MRANAHSTHVHRHACMKTQGGQLLNLLMDKLLLWPTALSAEPTEDMNIATRTQHISLSKHDCYMQVLHQLLAGIRLMYINR